MSRNKKVVSPGYEFSITDLSHRIYTLRGQQVMIDSDLAMIYNIETKNLKKAVRRNLERFPADFMFELSNEELELLRFQSGTEDFDQAIAIQGPIPCDFSGSQAIAKTGNGNFRFQSGTENYACMIRGGRYIPFVFTEPGVAMLSSVLQSPIAIQTNISIMRAFIQMRTRMLMNQIDLAPKIESIQTNLLELRQKIDVLQTPLRNLENTAELQELDKVKIIQKLVAQRWGLAADDLKSATRTKAVLLARQIAIFFIRKYVGLGFHEIGQHFGNRDHTTVLHAYRKIHADSEDRISIRKAIESLQNEIKPMFA